MTSVTCILILLASGAILSTAQKPVQKVCPSNCSLVRCAGIAPSVCNEKYNGVSVEGDGCCNCCRVCYVSAGRGQSCSTQDLGVSFICQAGMTCVKDICV